jgi:hypothetical protein
MLLGPAVLMVLVLQVHGLLALVAQALGLGHQLVRDGVRPCVREQKGGQGGGKAASDAMCCGRRRTSQPSTPSMHIFPSRVDGWQTLAILEGLEEDWATLGAPRSKDALFTFLSVWCLGDHAPSPGKWWCTSKALPHQPRPKS